MQMDRQNATKAGSGATQRGSLLSRMDWLPYIFFLPAFILVALASFLPLVYAIRQSFYRADFLNLGQFVGLGNYIEYLLEGGIYDLQRSIIYVLGTVIFSGIIGCGFALLLNNNLKFRGFYRTALILPWTVSQLITALLWSWVINPQLGPVTYGLAQIGIGLPNLLTSPDWSMFTLIQANAWRSYPLIMIFTLAALQMVPKDQQEAARIDGATGWQTFWYVTFPLIKNTIMVSIILTSLNSFNMVTLILVLTGGGPVGSTDVIALRVFKEGFQFYNMGIASAAAVIIFLLNMLFTLGYMRVLRTEKNT